MSSDAVAIFVSPGSDMDFPQAKGARIARGPRPAGAATEFEPPPQLLQDASSTGASTSTMFATGAVVGAAIARAMSAALGTLAFAGDPLVWSATSLAAWLLRQRTETVSLGTQVREAFRGIADAVYLQRDDEAGCWEVFVVAEDHTDELYASVVAAEDKLLAAGAPIIASVRARHGADVASVVPANAQKILPS